MCFETISSTSALFGFFEKSTAFKVFYDAIDINKDAVLDIKEFSNLLLMIDKQISREEIEYIFNKCDVKNRNEITFNMFKQIFQEHTEIRVGLNI